VEFIESVSEQEFIDFLEVCFDKNLKKIKDSLTKNPKLINARNSLGETILHILVINNNIDIVKYLHNHGANLNTIDICSCTSPLSDAVSIGNENIVKFLLHNGVSVRETYEMGNSILHEAIKSGDLKIIKILIDYGADIFKKNNFNETLQHISIENKKWNKITKFLIKKGLGLKEKTVFGDTPLDIATIERNSEIIEYLKQKKLPYENSRKKITNDR
jgi:ankyrin repeat protein